jgi:hypothetical protein
MEAIQTANKMFNYEQEFHGFTIDTLVQNAHKYNCVANKWTHIQLKKGSFGYDNLAVSIGYTLQNFIFNKLSNDKIIDILAELIHQGWCINYIYWRDNEPQIDKTFKYISPYNKLGDTRRNTCAITNFNDLDKEEKDKDYIIANFIYNTIYYDKSHK